MNFRKIVIIIILILGVYFIFIDQNTNVISINNQTNNNYGNNNYKRGELTEKYFSWVENSLKISDPKITEDLLNKFFNEVVVPELKLPDIKDSEIKEAASLKDNLKKYLEDTAKIKILPEDKNVDYIALAQKTAKDSNDKILKEVIDSIDSGISQLKEIAVPLEAKNVHKKYLGLIKYLRSMFNDLYFAKEDPIKINYNQRLTQKIIEISDEITKEREKLAKTVR